MKKLIEFFAKQDTLVNIITLTVFVVGAYALVKIRREVFPNINFDVITITTTFPGGSADSTERLITNPLEQDLREVDGIKKMTSVSAEGQSVIVVQLEPDQTNADDAEADIQDIVDSFTELPEDAEDPIVTVVESKLRPILEVSLSGNVSEEILRKTAKTLERDLEKLSDVAKVNFNGLRDFEIRVEAVPEKLKQYGLSMQDLIGAIQKHNINIPGGVLEASENNAKELIIRTIGEYETPQEVEDTVVRANALGRGIRVKDVAKVAMTFEKEKQIYATNTSRSINLTVLKKEKADAIRLVDQVKEKVMQSQPSFNPGVEVNFINDASYFVRRRISVLANNLLVGLALVLIVLSLVLPFKIALITAFGIPFSFLGALAIFHFGDISLNLISMMGLIIVVGMLVDDAVVVTENAQGFIEEGYPPKEAAIVSTQQIWAPVAASVTTTIMAFAPMLFMSGIFGKFIGFIPIGVILALTVSLAECFFILPHHVGQWIKVKNVKKIKEREHHGLFGRLWNHHITPIYQSVLAYAIKLRYGVAILTLLFVVGSIVFAAKKMDFILFPPGGVDTFVVNAESPIGTPLKTTTELLKPIEEYIQKLPKEELMDFTTVTGLQGEGAGNMRRGSEYAQVVVHLTGENERERTALEIIETIRKDVGTPEGLKKVTYERQRGGPPVGKPVSIGVRGENYSEIMPAVERLKQELTGLDGVSDIADSYIRGKEEIRLKIRESDAASAGLSFRDVGTAIRAAYEGIIATTIRKLDEEIDIRVTLAPKYRQSERTIRQLEIPNQRGNLIPLPQVAEWEKASGVAVYEHEDNQRQVNVTAEIDTNVTSSQAVNNLMRTKIDAFSKEYPAVRFYFGGEDSDTKESIASLVTAFMFAFFGILMLMILLFKNIYQPVVIAVTIPLGVISVIWAFYLHRQPLSFLGVVGIIALAGVIVNNAIVFVDFVNKARERGLDRFASVIDAGRRRLRPIFLTTVTTVVGILPTAYGIGGLDPFVVPIALALGWGMFFGSFLTAIVFPPILVIMDDFIAGLRWTSQKIAGLFSGSAHSALEKGEA